MVADRLRRLCSENVGVVLQHTLHPGHLTPRIHLRLSHGLQLDLVRYYRPEWGRQRRVRKIVALVPQQLRRFFFREAGHREKNETKTSKTKSENEKGRKRRFNTYVRHQFVLSYVHNPPLWDFQRRGNVVVLFSHLFTITYGVVRTKRAAQPAGEHVCRVHRRWSTRAATKEHAHLRQIIQIIIYLSADRSSTDHLVPSLRL